MTALVERDAVFDLSTSTGTGTIILLNQPPPGYRTFNDVLSVNDGCAIRIRNTQLNEWEDSIAVYAGTHQLARIQVLASSNAGNLVNFSPGSKEVYLTKLAETMPQVMNFYGATAGATVKLGAAIETLLTDATFGSEDFDLRFKQMINGAAASEVFRISGGNLVVAGGSNLTVNGGSLTVGNGITVSTGLVVSSGNLAVNSGNATVSGSATVGNGLTVSSGNLAINSGNATISGSLTAGGGAAISGGNLVFGSGALATNATVGFPYVPTMPGAPTGTPGAISGLAPFVFDSTNSKLNFYSGSQWHAFPGFGLNVKDFGAKGDNVADDTAAIAAAIAATPAGGTLYFPAGFYKVTGSGSTVFARNLPIVIIGEGQASTFLIFDTTVPNTRDMLTFTATLSSYQGIHIRDISFSAQSKGRDVLVIDAGSNLVYQVTIEQCFISESSAGVSIHLKNNISNSTIQRNNMASIRIESGGDGITIRENVISGTNGNNSIQATFLAGAGGFVVMSNVIAGTAGAVIIDNAAGPVIAFNEIETPISVTNTHGSLVDIGGTAVAGAVLLSNQYSVLTGTGDPVPIRIRTGAESVQIRENRLNNQTGNHIQIDTGALATCIDLAAWSYTNNVIVPLAVSDSGTRTTYWTTAATVTLPVDATGGDQNTSQPWFPAGGGTPLGIACKGATTYDFEGTLMTAKTGGTTARTVSFFFGGTATITSCSYSVISSTADTSTPPLLATPSFGYFNQASTPIVVVPSSSSAAQMFCIQIKGTIKINAAGTVNPRFQYSAAPTGGAPNILAGTYFRMRETR